MSLSVGVAIIMLLMAPPIIWVAWWMLADLGETARGHDRAAYVSTPSRRHRPAA